jgi:hypothetical protein
MQVKERTPRFNLSRDVREGEPVGRAAQWTVRHCVCEGQLAQLFVIIR